MIKRIRNISKDFIYNILASLVLTGIMQIVVYPLLAKVFAEAEYGLILTLMGIVNTIIVALGNTLNNVRLIVNTNYEARGIIGDFRLLLWLSSAIGVICVGAISISLFNQNWIQVIMLMLISFFGIYKSYYCVEFRLVLNFKKILIQNSIGAGGYVLGILIIYLFNQWLIWPIPFLFAEIAQLTYVLCNSSLKNENWRRTELLKRTTIKYVILIITGMSSTLITYLDRLIIYPLLGGEAVSIYTVASVFGKTLGIVMTPIAGVLLGYYAQKGFSMSQKKFWTINFIAVGSGCIFFGVSVLVSPFITRLLYPTIFLSAAQFIIWANLAAIINVVCSLTQSSVLKFAPTWLQIIKEGVYCLVYVGFGLFLLRHFGLFGFCIAAIAANTAKLISLYIIGLVFIGKKDLAYEQNN